MHGAGALPPPLADSLQSHAVTCKPNKDSDGVTSGTGYCYCYPRKEKQVFIVLFM